MNFSMSKKEITTKEITTSKQFSYSKKDISLDFNLKVDNSSELRDFRDILTQALKDVNEEIDKMKN